MSVFLDSSLVQGKFHFFIACMIRITRLNKILKSRIRIPYPNIERMRLPNNRQLQPAENRKSWLLTRTHRDYSNYMFKGPMAQCNTFDSKKNFQAISGKKKSRNLYSIQILGNIYKKKKKTKNSSRKQLFPQIQVLTDLLNQINNNSRNHSDRYC